MRLPMRSWDNTLKSMGFRKQKRTNKKSAKRFSFESLEDRKLLSAVPTLDPVLLSPPELVMPPGFDGAVIGSNPNAPGHLVPTAPGQRVAPPQPPHSNLPGGLAGGALLAAALSQVDLSTAATFSLSGGTVQAGWSQTALGPQALLRSREYPAALARAR